jgi:hypothetical protein
MRFNYVCVTTELVPLCTKRSKIVFPIGKYKDALSYTPLRFSVLSVLTLFYTITDL